MLFNVVAAHKLLFVLMLLSVLFFVAIRLVVDGLQATKYECGPHGKFEYCIDSELGCVVGCHCHPGFYFNTLTMICESSEKLHNPQRKNFIPEGQPPKESTTTERFIELDKSLDQKVDAITRDADALSDWLYENFFKAIEKGVINETQSTYRKNMPFSSESHAPIPKLDRNKSKKKMATADSVDIERTMSKIKKPKKTIKNKLKKLKKKMIKDKRYSPRKRRKTLRNSETDSFDTSSSDTDSSTGSDDGFSDFSSSDDTDSSLEIDKYKDNKRHKDGRIHRKIIRIKKKKKPPPPQLPSFVFLPNVETPYYPPYGIPAPPPAYPMFPMVPIPPILPCVDCNVPSSSTTTIQENGSTGATVNTTTEAPTTTAEAPTTTANASQGKDTNTSEGETKKPILRQNAAHSNQQRRRRKKQRLKHLSSRTGFIPEESNSPLHPQDNSPLPPNDIGVLGDNPPWENNFSQDYNFNDWTRTTNDNMDKDVQHQNFDHSNSKGDQFFTNIRKEDPPKRKSISNDNDNKNTSIVHQNLININNYGDVVSVYAKREKFPERNERLGLIPERETFNVWRPTETYSVSNDVSKRERKFENGFSNLGNQISSIISSLNLDDQHRVDIEVEPIGSKLTGVFEENFKEHPRLFEHNDQISDDLNGHINWVYQTENYDKLNEMEEAVKHSEVVDSPPTLIDLENIFTVIAANKNGLHPDNAPVNKNDANYKISTKKFIEVNHVQAGHTNGNPMIANVNKINRELDSSLALFPQEEIVINYHNFNREGYQGLTDAQQSTRKGTPVIVNLRTGRDNYANSRIYEEQVPDTRKTNRIRMSAAKRKNSSQSNNKRYNIGQSKRSNAGINYFSNNGAYPGKIMNRLSEPGIFRVPSNNNIQNHLRNDRLLYNYGQINNSPKNYNSVADVKMYSNVANKIPNNRDFYEDPLTKFSGRENHFGIRGLNPSSPLKQRGYITNDHNPNTNRLRSKPIPESVRKDRPKTLYLNPRGLSYFDQQWNSFQPPL